MSDKISGKNFLIGAVVGGVLGAITALVLAPKPGKELREDISNQVDKISGKTVELAGTVGGKTQELAKVVSTQSVELASKAREVAGAIAEVVTEVVADEVKAWKEARGSLPEIAPAAEEAVQAAVDEAAPVAEEADAIPEETKEA